MELVGCDRGSEDARRVRREAWLLRRLGIRHAGGDLDVVEFVKLADRGLVDAGGDGHLLCEKEFDSLRYRRQVRCCVLAVQCLRGVGQMAGEVADDIVINLSTP